MNKFKLKELLEIKNGSDWKKHNKGNVPVYGSGGVMNYIDSQIYSKESILLPRKGTLNNIMFVNEPFWTVDTMYWTIINTKKAVPRYLYYYLKLLDLSKLNSGTGVPSMTFDSYYDVDVFLPSLDKQKKVAKFLSIIDDKINKNNTINAELERITNLLYNYWFIQYQFPDENEKPYKTSGGIMVYNKEIKKDIPKGWKYTNLLSVVSGEKNAIVDGPFGTQMKIENYVKLGIPIVEMENLNGYEITDEFTKFITPEKYDDVKRSAVRYGDIIISKTGTLGLLGIMNNKVEKAVIVSRLAKITPDNNLMGKYTLLQNLKKLNENNYWLRQSSGSTMPILNNDIIKNAPILLPTKEVLKNYEKLISPLFEKINKNLIENSELEKLRDWLLPMLINGQVDTSNIQ